MVDGEKDLIMTAVGLKCPPELDQKRDEFPYICTCTLHALKYCGCTGQCQMPSIVW